MTYEEVRQSLVTMINYHKNKALLQLSLKDFKGAYEHQQKLLLLKDSFHLANEISKLDNIESRYQNNLLKAGNDLLLEQNKRKDLVNTIVIYGIIVIGVLFFVFAYLFARNHRLNKRLSRALENEKTLTKEINHRVKNNLQMISSLLEMQYSSTNNPEAANILKEGQNRVQSVALLHQKLYQTDDVSKVDFSEYIRTLWDQLSEAFSNQNQKVEITLDIPESVNLDVDVAVPLSLIVNELITNSYKHAFKHIEEGVINISIKKEQDILIFMYKDNGPGYDFEISKSKGSLGLSLIHILSRQLKAILNIKDKGDLTLTIG